MSIDALQHAAARTSEMYKKWRFFNIFEIHRLNLRNDSNVKSGYMSGTPDFVQKPSFSKQEDYGDGNAVPRASSLS